MVVYGRAWMDTEYFCIIEIPSGCLDTENELTTTIST